jgi:hypothetical protein
MHISPREVNAALKKMLTAKPKEAARNQLGRHPYIDYRRVPSKRLMGKLNILDYDVHPNIYDKAVSPDRVGLYLGRHIGAPAIPVVTPGERVEQGQVVAKIPEKALGAMLHASITGRVEIVDSEKILLVKE